LAPTHYSQFWRSLLSADHSSRPKRAQEHEWWHVSSWYTYIQHKLLLAYPFVVCHVTSH
jgi:hypothetical protein